MTTRITAIRNLPTDRLLRHPRNVREDIGDVDELAHSLAVQGILQPILVAPRDNDTYVVLDGNRRLYAARQAGIPTLPCLITTEGSREATTATMLAAAMHKQLTPLEQADAFRDLLNSGLTISQIASRTGYTTATVRDRLRLQHLPEQVKDDLAAKRITVGAATTLARQVAKNGAGAATLKATKSRHFSHAHHLAGAVAAACNHEDTRVLVGGIGCGQCWETAIRNDASRTPAA